MMDQLPHKAVISHLLKNLRRFLRQEELEAQRLVAGTQALQNRVGLLKRRDNSREQSLFCEQVDQRLLAATRANRTLF